MATSLTSQRRAQALFKAFDSDFLLREQFVTDPAQILAEYVDGSRLPTDAATAANRMLYAVLSSPGLRQWVQGYAAAHRGAVPDEQQFDADFAKAIASSGDDEVVHALIVGAKDQQNVFAAQASLLRTLIGVLGLAGGSVASTEMSPGTATEQSPGVTATEISPGAFGRPEFGRVGQVFAETEISPGTATEQSPGVTATEISPGAFGRPEFGRVGQVFAETEMSPGTGTEITPGVTATEISPGAFGRVGDVFADTEMSPGTATEQSPGVTATEISPGAFGRVGDVFADTEMSPGTATEQSPGVTATEISPGSRFGFVDIASTFGALVQFANELRAAGALRTLGT